MTPKALDGIKVLELSEYISGPYCAKLLGAFGAEVIKIEKPRRGDRARWIGAKSDKIRPDKIRQDRIRLDEISCDETEWDKVKEEDVHRAEKSPLFLYLNTNKKSITLDYRSQKGKKIFIELVKRSDVLVENQKPGYLDNIGLGYDKLEQINPGLVMASITDFGQTGVYRDFSGGRLVGYAMSGYMYVNGEPYREPLAGGGEQPAYQGGINGYNGILSALIKRNSTNHGDYIDVSIMECMAAIHQYTINQYVYSGKIQKRSGGRHMWAHPVTIYPCKDGYVSIGAVTQDQVERLMTMMELPEVLNNPMFKTGRDRVLNADEFDALVMPWFKEKTSNIIVESCREWRIPAARVNRVEDLLADPQYKARDFWTNTDHPVAGHLPYPTAPFKMSETPAIVGRAPLLGEHNKEVYLDDLGLERDKVYTLMKEGVI